MHRAALGAAVHRCETRRWVFAFALIMQGAAPARAAEVCEAPVGRFISVEGSVEVQRSGQESWRMGTLDEPLRLATDA